MTINARNCYVKRYAGLQCNVVEDRIKSLSITKSKTMTAEAYAGTLGVPLLILNLAKVLSRFVGDSEQKIERALSIAKASAPCVLLLDEMEKVIG